LDIYNRALTEVIRGLRMVVIDRDYATTVLSNIGSLVASKLSDAMESIIGRRVEFALDEDYLKVWEEYAALTSDIETYERLRLLAQRILGWVLYRVATGYVTEEELGRLTQLLLTDFRFTAREAEAVSKMASVLAGIAVREYRATYVPTLGMLATMMEYIDVPMDLITRVFAERRVDEPWASLWLRYVITRSVSSETNTMVTTFRGLVERYAVPQEVVNSIYEFMRAGGWTDRELDIFSLDLELRRIRRLLDTFTPTLRQFVADAQYLNDWEAALRDWLAIRGIEAERYRAQVDYYRKLIRNRKANRRIAWYITRVMNAYSAGVISLDDARRRLERLKEFGLDDVSWT